MAGGVHGKGGMCGEGWHAWQGCVCGMGVYMVGGCDREHAWQGGMLGRDVCMAGGVHGRGCAWQGVCMAGGHGMAGEMATAADGMHPTGMLSNLKI